MNLYNQTNKNDNFDSIMKDLINIQKIQNDIKTILNNDKEELDKITDNMSNTQDNLNLSLVEIQDSKKIKINYKTSILLGSLGFILFGPVGGVITGLNTGLLTGFASGLIGTYVGKSLV